MTRALVLDVVLHPLTHVVKEIYCLWKVSLCGSWTTIFICSWFFNNSIRLSLLLE